MRVWDLPLRIFHWGLVIAIIGAVGSAKADVMWLHERIWADRHGACGVSGRLGIFGWLLRTVQPVFDAAAHSLGWHLPTAKAAKPPHGWS